MMTPADHALLQQFADDQSEAAFAALVNRHLPLVHSAALRRAHGDAHLAAEIAQATFIILARKAGTLAGGWQRRLVAGLPGGGGAATTSLTGWLYRTTQYVAADALRQNRRRQQREHQAYMEATLNRGGDASSPTANESIWQQLAPVLDEAMHALRTADRDAVLLRYFENKSLADVGAVLGVTEDAARVRVNRALDKLRALLAKQGIKFGATAIAAAVAANAVSAAPVALAASITTAVLTGTSLTLATVAMTTLQKIAVTAALTVTIGGGLFAAKQAHDAQNEVRTLQAQQAPLAAQVQQLQAERDKATNQIAWMKEELGKNEKNNLELLKLRGDVGLLRNQLTGAKQTDEAIQASLTNQNSQASTPDTKTIEMNKCLNNLRQIDAAMQQYALEHNLSETNVVTAENILPYLIQAQIPQCPSGGTYVFGKLNEVPSCSVPGHALPSSVESPAIGLKYILLQSAIAKDRFAPIKSADIKAAIQRYKDSHDGQAPQSQGEWLLYLTAYGSKYQAAIEAYANAHYNQMPTNAIDLLPYWQE